MKKLALLIFTVITIPILAYIGLYIYGVYFYEADPATRAYIEEKDPIKKMELLEAILNESEYSRWAWLDDAAELAYEIKDYDKAREYSIESLALSRTHKNDWNYGNSIHNSNMVLGRISLKDGNTEKAKEYLLESAKSPGSPQLNTFGPSLYLANELLMAGEKDVVLSYLQSISTFWEMDDGCINQWVTQIKNDEKPDLCKCGCNCK